MHHSLSVCIRACTYTCKRWHYQLRLMYSVHVKLYSTNVISYSSDHSLLRPIYATSTVRNVLCKDHTTCMCTVRDLFLTATVDLYTSLSTDTLYMYTCTCTDTFMTLCIETCLYLGVSFMGARFHYNYTGTCSMHVCIHAYVCIFFLAALISCSETSSSRMCMWRGPSWWLRPVERPGSRGSYTSLPSTQIHSLPPSSCSPRWGLVFVQPPTCIPYCLAVTPCSLLRPARCYALHGPLERAGLWYCSSCMCTRVASVEELYLCIKRVENSLRTVLGLFH